MRDTDDVYTEGAREELVDDGSISPEEEAFIAGYESEEESKEENEDEDEEKEE